MRTSPIVIALILGLGLVGTADAAPKPKPPPPGPTEITACQDITQPGAYVVVNNLTAAASDCIHVSADVVSIDLAGFTIDMTGSPLTATAGIRNIDPGAGAGFADGLSVRGGTITGFASGILIEGGIGHRIEGVRVVGNTVAGIRIEFGGFPPQGVANMIKDNVIVGNGTGAGGTGGLVFNCPGAILGNIIADNGPTSPSTNLAQHIGSEQFVQTSCLATCTFMDNVPDFNEFDFAACF